MNYKILALIIICAIFCYKMILNIISIRSADNPIPDNVSDVYDSETYKTWRKYNSDTSRVELFSDVITFVVSILLIDLNVYSAFASLFPDTLFMQMLAVIILSALAGLIGIPIDYYDTMVVEEKYGFNKTGIKTFWSDQVKEQIISFGLMLGIGGLLLWIHQTLGDWMIVVFAIVMMVIVLFIAFLFPILSRIFNKFSPLEDEELREKLTTLLQKHGYKVRAIHVMDASRRTTKSNAYFAGFGKMKTIVLYDTILEQLSHDEICAVFAHELGHGLHKDTLKSQIFTAVMMVVLAVLSWLTLKYPEIYLPFGFKGVNYGFALILIITVEFALTSPVFGLITNAFSRKAEYRADKQAVDEGYGEALISALKKLARENFSVLAPDPLLVKLEYSHPPLSERIKAIQDAL